MGWTRRQLLATGSVFASAATAGCVDRFNPLSGDGEPDTGGGSTAGPESTSTPTATATPTAAATAAVSRSDSATEQAIAEVVWHVSRFRPTADRYLSAAGRALGLLQSLDDRASVSPADLDRLESLFGQAETVLYDRLVPHFDAEPTVATYNDDRLAELETLRERSDWDAAQALLRRMVTRYETLASEAYVEQTFPTDPVAGRLARVLTRPSTVEDAVVAAYDAPTDTVLDVRRDTDAYVPDRLPGGRTDLPGYEETFDPVSVAASRTRRIYLTYTTLRGEQRSLPVFVQRYEDGRRAESAVRRALSESGAVTTDGTQTLGERTWRRVFYQSNESVTYAFAHRAGRHLLVAAPSPTPWDERPKGWDRPLELGWFWR